MKNSNWHKFFFDKYYLPFIAARKKPSDTAREALFVQKILGLKKEDEILDLACGTCRHGIELAKKGFKITGLDFDAGALKIAKKIAAKNKIKLKLVKGDIRKVSFKNKFNAGINMFTSFGYFEKDSENVKVLREVNKSLKAKGLFLLDLQNKEWILQNLSKKTWEKLGDTYILEKRFFYKNKGIFANEITFVSPKGKVEKTFTHNHLYDLSKIRVSLKRTGFRIVKVFGDYDASKYNVRRSPRMIILAKKIK